MTEIKDLDRYIKDIKLSKYTEEFANDFNLSEFKAMTDAAFSERIEDWCNDEAYSQLIYDKDVDKFEKTHADDIDKEFCDARNIAYEFGSYEEFKKYVFTSALVDIIYNEILGNYGNLLEYLFLKTLKKSKVSFTDEDYKKLQEKLDVVDNEDTFESKDEFFNFARLILTKSK